MRTKVHVTSSSRTSTAIETRAAVPRSTTTSDLEYRDAGPKVLCHDGDRLRQPCAGAPSRLREGGRRCPRPLLPAARPRGLLLDRHGRERDAERRAGEG